MRYINADSLVDYIEKRMQPNDIVEVWKVIKMIEHTPTELVKPKCEIVRCEDCLYHHLEQNAEHGKLIHNCSALNKEVFKGFYCYFGIRKMSEEN